VVLARKKMVYFDIKVHHKGYFGYVDGVMRYVGETLTVEDNDSDFWCVFEAEEQLSWFGHPKSDIYSMWCKDPAVVNLLVGLVQFLNDVDALEMVRIAQKRGLVELFMVHGDGAAEGSPEIGYVDVGGDPPNEQDEGAVAEDAAPNAEAGVGVVNEVVPDDKAQAIDIDEASQHDVEEAAAVDEAAQNDEEVAAVAVNDAGQNDEADEIVVDEIERTDVAEAEVVDEAARNEGKGDRVEKEAGQGAVSAGDDNVEDGVGGLSDLEN
ncbi:hypothetical protein PIB30_065118, partial [Stylosanthes scabra]|nr:hypothetical protein [Stylosanthes scabra]